MSENPEGVASYQLAQDVSLNGPNCQLNKYILLSSEIVGSLSEGLFGLCLLLPTNRNGKTNVRNTLLLKHGMKYFRPVARHSQKMHLRV